jgi:hypothetical protein
MQVRDLRVLMVPRSPRLVGAANSGRTERWMRCRRGQVLQAQEQADRDPTTSPERACAPPVKQIERQVNVLRSKLHRPWLAFGATGSLPRMVRSSA